MVTTRIRYDLRVRTTRSFSFKQNRIGWSIVTGFRRKKLSYSRFHLINPTLSKIATYLIISNVFSLGTALEFQLIAKRSRPSHNPDCQIRVRVLSVVSTETQTQTRILTRRIVDPIRHFDNNSLQHLQLAHIIIGLANLFETNEIEPTRRDVRAPMNWALEETPIRYDTIRYES